MKQAQTLYQASSVLLQDYLGKFGAYCQMLLERLLNSLSRWVQKGLKQPNHYGMVLLILLLDCLVKWQNIGKNIVEGIWNGIKNAKDWLLSKIGDFANGVVDGIKGFFGIHSPSKVMRDAIGKFLPPGIAVGF